MHTENILEHVHFIYNAALASLPASSEAASIGRTECGEDNKERNDPRHRVKHSVSKSLRWHKEIQVNQL